MTITVDVRRRLGAFRLDTRFTAKAGLTAIFGRSGSGKTSLIDLVAGLSRPDDGRIEAEGTVFADTSQGIFLPPHRRRIGYVFQDARLFPHMSVRTNLGFGRRFAGRRRSGDAGEFDRVVELLGIGHLLDRRPAGLSGGERQRVAIGRALLSRPRLLLMDEPLAALDEARKAEVLPHIERLRDEAGLPILYVSHSVGEVLRLGTDMVALDGGRVVAQGPPEEVLGRLDLLPAGAEAEIGRSLDAVVEEHDEAYGLTLARVGAARLFLPRFEAHPGAPVRLRVRARDVMLATGALATGISALNVLPVTIRGFSAEGAAGMDVRLDCEGQELLARITRRSFDALGLHIGLPVHAILKAVSFDRRSGVKPAVSLDREIDP
ncbi:molybdenum ABC transporter ATP-binding protein [Aureimonas psammosilenae]|uniref:molybdenum ABC transporter ATP-binding protein n=1 Tax=Aureimonas psammosilenae TaxID=2495496 RepID=UPI00126071BE|nr:molybdenum ABC transporter ATP-binding protein [Aureimonas psammosilenae]